MVNFHLKCTYSVCQFAMKFMCYRDWVIKLYTDLIPSGTVMLEKMRAARLAYYGTRRLITVFKTTGTKIKPCHKPDDSTLQLFIPYSCLVIQSIHPTIFYCKCFIQGQIQCAHARTHTHTHTHTHNFSQIIRMHHPTWLFPSLFPTKNLHIFVSLPCVSCVTELIWSPKATYYANFSNLLLLLLHPIVEHPFVRSSVREIKVSHSQAKKQGKTAICNF